MRSRKIGSCSRPRVTWFGRLRGDDNAIWLFRWQGSTTVDGEVLATAPAICRDGTFRLPLCSVAVRAIELGEVSWRFLFARLFTHWCMATKMLRPARGARRGLRDEVLGDVGMRRGRIESAGGGQFLFTSRRRGSLAGGAHGGGGMFANGRATQERGAFLDTEGTCFDIAYEFSL